MTTTRKKIFIFTGLVAGLIIVLILIFIFLIDKPEDNTPNGLANSPDQSEISFPVQNNEESFQDTDTGIFYNTDVNLLADGAPRPDITEQYLRQLASIFVERFNSYSNQNDNTHIEDASEMATDRMKRWIQTQKVVQSSNYEGVVTEVFATEMERLYDIRAVIRVQAKVTSISGGREQVEYKTGHVDLLEEVENEWLVDKFVWDE